MGSEMCIRDRYKEGPDQMESDDNLHLCVSAKDDRLYRIACKNVEKLLNGIYNDYCQYTRDCGREVNLQIKRIDLNNNSNAQNGGSVGQHQQNVSHQENSNPNSSESQDSKYE